jgi:hypothetical protein
VKRLASGHPMTAFALDHASQCELRHAVSLSKDQLMPSYEFLNANLRLVPLT